ncbi:hypothetical protein [Williamsia maris]|uniref:Glycine zipper family protein n=1 Tax=Williamsia maris TaxID=72806 RepID=A0ABT1HEF6_9NOCA|nr:hypothetical protein [Williamsia maris]MCP2176637.1 hypothetical protein [Williamsia maris]
MNLRKAFVSAVATIACTAGIVAAAGEASAAPATPTKPSAAAQAPGRVQVDQPLTRAERDQQALNQLGSSVSTAVSIGALAGTGVGAVAGCIIGGIIIPAVGCIPGVITGAGFGGIVGTIGAGGPTLAGAVDQYIKTINSPFTPPKSITIPLTPAR